MRKYLFSILSVVGILILGAYSYSLHEKLGEVRNTNNLLEADRDSLKKVFNKKTQEWEYSRLAYKAENEELNKFLKQNKEELYKLKKENKALVGIISETQIRIDTVVLNEKVVEYDSTVRVANIKNPFYIANILSYTDRTSLSVRMQAKLNFLIGPNGNLIATTNNPYLDLVQLESFYVTPAKQKSKNWKYLIGFGLGLSTNFIK